MTLLFELLSLLTVDELRTLTERASQTDAVSRALRKAIHDEILRRSR